MSELCEDYLKLVKRFRNKELSIEEFQTLYFGKFLHETRKMSEEEYQALDELFADLDIYTEDEELLRDFPNNYQDEKSLLNKVDIAIARLENLCQLSGR